MGTFDELLVKGKNKKPEVDFSKNTFVSLLGNKKTSFKERLTGTPTKNYDNTYKANTGVLPFLGAVKDVFTSGTKGTGKILGESMDVNRGAFDGLNEANLQNSTTKYNLLKKINENKKLGKDNTRLVDAYNQLNSRPTDTIQSLAPESQSSNLKALGNLGMMATELTGLSSVARTGKALGYLGKEAEKQALKNLTAQELKKRLATEVAFNTGQGYVADVSMRAQNDEKNFKPGLGTALGFGLTGLLGNQQMNRTLNEQSAARIAEKKAQTFPIPETGTPPVGYFKALPERATPPRSPTIELPAPGILKSAEDIRNPKPTPVPETPKSPITQKAESFNSRNDFVNNQLKEETITKPADLPNTPQGNRAIGRNKVEFIGNEIAFLRRTKQPIPKNYSAKLESIWEASNKKPVQVLPSKNRANELAKIWDEAHSTPRQTGLPKLKNEPVSQPVNTRPINPDTNLPYGAYTNSYGKVIIPDSPNSSLQGKARMETPSPQEPLMAEARKYKSAEDFVKGGIFSEARDSGSRNIIRKSLESKSAIKNVKEIKVNPNNPALDKSTVQIKLEDIKEGKRPYVLVDENNQLIDGHHAFEAYKKAGIDDIPTVTKSQLTDIWNKAVKETIPVQQSFDDIIKEKATPSTPKTPDFEAKVNSDTDWLSKVENKTSESDVRGFKQSSERYAQRLNEDKESLIDYAMGLGDEDPKLPRTSARKLLARDADIENNPDLSEKLSFSTVKRESGQELVGNKIFEEQTTADLLEITRRKRADKLGISENQLRAEEARLFKEIAEDMSKKVSYTTDDLLDIVKDFLC